ncbi:MAG: XRE family transcriptional regulator [Bacteroidia bacterium]|nr:XRE family transcriptional regulator [Bacteroidia bacterium]
MNNLKQIREIYGATQEQIAEALAVNRVTVANWESGNSTASSGNREKLSIYYGIGPEYLYDKELDETARQLVIDTAAKAKSVAAQSGGKLSKEDDFHKMFESLTFPEAMSRYMFSMKMLLATADSGELEKLKTASLINKKMGERLDAIIKLREKEAASDEPSLFDLLNEDTSSN